MLESVEIRLTFWHDRRYPKSGDVTSYLVSHIIRPESYSLKRIRNKIIYLPMQRCSDFAIFVTDRHVKLQLFDRLQISGQIHHCFGEALTCFCVVINPFMPSILLKGQWQTL